MTVSRSPACRVKGCPAPKDPDWHKPHCGHGLEGHHHHVPKRSQGGKRIVAFLCPKCHDEVDNGISLGNQIWKDKGGREHYLLYDMAKGPSEPIVDRVLEAGKGQGDGLHTGDSHRNGSGMGTPLREVEHGDAEPDSGSSHVPLNHRGSAHPLSVEAGSAAATGVTGTPGPPEKSVKLSIGSRETAPVNTSLSDTVAAAPPASGGEGGGQVKVPFGRKSGSRTAERRGASEARSEGHTGVVPAGPLPASGESSAAEPLDEGAHPSPARDSSLVPSPSAAPPSFNKDVWCREGMQLVYWYIAVRDATDEVRFKIGDWYNEGDRVLGEEAPGYLRGFEDVTVRQYSWVAGRVSPDTRVSELSWTMHRAVAALEAPKQKEWLERAQEENLSSKGLYRAIHGEKPKVKRWTLEELRQERYGTEKQRIIILAFLDWLGAK